MRRFRLPTTAAAALVTMALVAAALPGAGAAVAGRSAGGDPGRIIKTRSSAFGTVLIDGKRRTIYAFDKEETRKSECYGDCAHAWPPVLTNGRPWARGKARAGLLGTTRRNNGRKQVTYKGHPLYYYAAEDPGQILCQNVNEFGGRWLVLRPSGNPVR